jgi:hypothetical protein
LRRLQQVVQKHADDLEEHARGIVAERAQIAANERQPIGCDARGVAPPWT